MVKKLFPCLIVSVLLIGCNRNDIVENIDSNAQTEESSTSETFAGNELQNVLEFETTWETEERKLVNYPENASYLGSNEQGYFYYIWDTEQDPNNTNKTFCFQTWEGEIQNLLEDSGNAFSTFLHQGQLFISLPNGEGITVIGIDSKGNLHEYVSENMGVLPMIYGYENALLVLTYDRDIKTNETRYTISEIDLINHAAIPVYQSQNHITAISGDEQNLLFAEEDESGNSILYQYDKKTKTVIKSVMLEKTVVFAVNIEDKVYFSERGNLGEALGGIYSWEKNELVKTGLIPLVSDDNIIWDGKKADNLYLWKAQKNGFLFDSENDRIYVLDFEAIMDAGGARCMDDAGFSSVFKRGKDFYHVKYSVK